MTRPQQPNSPPKRSRPPPPTPPLNTSKKEQNPTNHSLQNIVWASLITNLSYLPGLLTLHHSLNNPDPDSYTDADTDTVAKASASASASAPPSQGPGTKTGTETGKEKGTKYPFIAFYTSTFPAEGLSILAARNIKAQLVPSIRPNLSLSTAAYAQDPRFAETWNKLVVFSLEEYERVILLDGDILIRRDMDELMEVPLDGEKRVLRRRMFVLVIRLGRGIILGIGVGMLNSGVLVVQPSSHFYAEIENGLRDIARIEKYTFPDQELLSDVFRGRWVALPYVYNALKTLRMKGVHDVIWRDGEVRAVHYIFAKKPWHEDAREGATGSGDGSGLDGLGLDETGLWWWRANWERMRVERGLGILDEFSGGSA
ncbi:Glycosyl transferase family 8 [Penicillium sp. DV-2018c]|nr:Glycosyl transferase family 8 [Penicillium sp. DV-2018c]